ncbi:MAG: hypothetical protein OXR07_04785 [Nitrospira sp.]|nr:hypothetical protein [Nitrospira sp.]
MNTVSWVTAASLGGTIHREGACPWRPSVALDSCVRRNDGGGLDQGTEGGHDQGLGVAVLTSPIPAGDVRERKDGTVVDE